MALPSDRWPEVKQILAMVVNIPGLERQDFLKNACGSDTQLRGEVESLLACHELAEEAGVLARLNSLGVSPRKALDAWAAALEPTVSFKRHDGETTTIAPSAIYRGEGTALESFGDYELLGELGRGGMGVVYKARQKSLNRLVALKMISSRGFSQEEAERFRIEAQAAGKLDHPGIAPVYEVGEHDGRHYYSMAFIDGPSLSSYLRERDKKLSYHEAAGFIEKIADAMQYAHEKGVIHRDLKPGNIMLDKQGTVKVVDFGLARELESDSNLTQDGQFLGTPSYAPPEQGLRAQKVGPAADVYAIGAILYTLLTDLPPFRADNVAETILLVRNTEPVAPQIIDRKLPKDLQTICLKCLEKDPGKRYPSARELADEARRFLNGEPIEARPISSVERAWRWSRRKPALAALILVTVLSIPLAFGGLLYHIRQLNEGNERSRSALQGSINAISNLLTNVSAEKLSDKPGMHEVRADLLRMANDEFNDLLEKHGDDAILQTQLITLKIRLAEVQYDMGEIREEIESISTALAWHNQAKSMLAPLLEDDPENASLLEQMSDIHIGIGKCLTGQQNLPDAITEFEAALKIRERLARLNAKDQVVGRKYANALMNLGIAAKSLGMKNADLEPLKIANAQLLKSLEVRENLLSDDATNAELLRDQGKCSIELASVRSMLPEKRAEVRQTLETAAKYFSDAKDVDPSDLDNPYFVGMCYRFLGGTASEVEAREYYKRSLAVLEPLAAENPMVHRYRGALAGTHADFGALLYENPSELTFARQHIESAVHIFTALVRDGATEFEPDLAAVTDMFNSISTSSEQDAIAPN